MQAPSALTTFLFTDIESSSRLWEENPERMRLALARHDEIGRAAVETNRGAIVKMSGDGIHAAFADPLDAVNAALQFQRDLAEVEATQGVALKVRCGVHVGVHEQRDNDFFGTAVNRAARIMNAAHGGQVLLSQAVKVLVAERLPPGVALRDLGSVRLRDLASPEYVYQLLHPQLREDFPALRTLGGIPNNLPQQVTSFVGREREKAEVTKLLASMRFLTLLGVGGLGKTRLSLQVAADLMDDYPDGVWFVDLAPLVDERLVPQAVATVLGVKEEAGRPVLEALVKYVDDRQLLLILDNCEHLLDACAELAKELLESGTRLKILASSREPMRVAGETTYALPSLSVPHPHCSVTLQSVAQYEAARLFIDRARAVQPSFQVTERNMAAVCDICQRLDGIPLAIELAAARVRVLSAEQIGERLTDRFHLLTRGDRTALPRQQTLRALIDWSYDLLSQRQRAVFRSLAVFAGGWTLKAAEAIAADGDVATRDVLDVLTDLVEKSLVVLEAERERYRLLETVRQYAQERLDESGEGNRVRGRHLAFYLALAEMARPELLGPNQGMWLAKLDSELENLIAAHAWCDREEGGAELGLRLVYSVKFYCLNRGLVALGLRLTAEALERAGAQERSLARCRALQTAGQLGFFMGRYAEAQGNLEGALSIAREIGEKGRIAAVLQALGNTLIGQGELAAANRHLEEALALAKEEGNKREVAAATNALAQLRRVEGKLDSAELLCEKVLALARELNDRETIAIGLLNLAMVSAGRGSPDRARRMLLEALAIAVEIGSQPAGQSVLEVCACLASCRREWEHAVRFYGAAEGHSSETGLHRDPADEMFLAALIAQARQNLGAAAFAQAEVAGRALTYETAMSQARLWLEHADVEARPELPA